MNPLTFLALAGALGLVGSSTRVGTRPGRPPVAAGRRSRSPDLRTLRVVAAAASGTGCVALFGWFAGAVAAAVVAPAAWFAVGLLHARSVPVTDPAGGALCLDLFAVALRAGRPVADALAHASPAGGELAPVLGRAGGLLRLGADADQAWAAAGTHPALGPLAALAARSSTSGIRLAAAAEHRARELRAEARAGAVRRAQRAQAFVAAPLGLCFLPAFACLGIVPIVVGVARDVLR